MFLFNVIATGSDNDLYINQAVVFIEDAIQVNTACLLAFRAGYLSCVLLASKLFFLLFRQVPHNIVLFYKAKSEYQIPVVCKFQ